MNDIYNSS